VHANKSRFTLQLNVTETSSSELGHIWCGWLGSVCSITNETAWRPIFRSPDVMVPTSAAASAGVLMGAPLPAGIVGYFSKRAANRPTTNLIYGDRYASAAAAVYRSCRPNSTRGVDIFQTSSLGCLLLNYRLCTQCKATRPRCRVCIIGLSETSGRHVISRRIYFESLETSTSPVTAAVH